MKAEKEYDSKMRISCEMVEDLLPLYLDDSCSKDSRIAVEEHLRACQDCSAISWMTGRSRQKDRSRI